MNILLNHLQYLDFLGKYEHWMYLLVQVTFSHAIFEPRVNSNNNLMVYKDRVQSKKFAYCYLEMITSRYLMLVKFHQ